MRSNDTNKIIAVGINKELNDDGLQELFGDFGTIADCKVVMDASTGLSKGFGFITFASSAAMRNAIRQMHRKVIDNRVLNVREVIAKEKRSTVGSMKSTQECWEFKRGECMKGEHCKYSHQASVGDYGTCFEFAQHGNCKRGDNCKFTHTGTTMVAGDKLAGNKKDKVVDNTEQRICFAFQKGSCHRGKGCRFLHKVLMAEKINVKLPEPFKAEGQKTEKEVESKVIGKRKKVDDNVTSTIKDKKTPKLRKIEPERRMDSLADLLEMERQAQITLSKAKSARIALEEKLDAAKNEIHIIKDTKKPSVAKPIMLEKIPQASIASKKAPKAEESCTDEEEIKVPNHLQKESLDMGAAFDNLSDSEVKLSSKQSAKVGSARSKRQALKKAKKMALERLKSKQTVEL